MRGVKGGGEWGGGGVHKKAPYQFSPFNVYKGWNFPTNLSDF